MPALSKLRSFGAMGFLVASVAPALAMSDADDACIEALRATGTPDAQSGQVLSSEFSEAGTLVMLEDAGGSTWRCIAYSDGAIGELSVVDAMDDGGGAMDGAGSSGPVVSGTQQVQFAKGTSGAAMTGTLASNTSVRYVVNARNEQFLNVDVSSLGGALDYKILNPDGSELLGLMGSDTPYEGQLWQSGDHVVEVLNAGAQPVSFDIGIGIK